MIYIDENSSVVFDAFLWLQTNRNLDDALQRV